MTKQYIRYIYAYMARICTKSCFLRIFKKDPFVRFISTHDMNTLIWIDYEALVGLVGF